MEIIFSQCTNDPRKNITAAVTGVIPKTPMALEKPDDNAAAILARAQVPVLCYHHIRDWNGHESGMMKTLLVPVANFKAQIKSLADSGYHTITPDQYNAYLTRGEPLPPKPVMITFDDTDLEQFTIGAAELNKYHYKGVFFVMTISIGRPRYMSAAQLKELADSGHVVAAHTWDHHRVDKYMEQDYESQLIKPKQKLEAITGKPVNYFAYPFGIVNPKIYPVLEKEGYKAAYQLVEYKRDSTYPLYTIRRMIVPGNWDGAHMQKWMKTNFK